MKNFVIGGIVLTSMALAFNACSPAGGEKTGHEYMPDMAHSIAYEANVLNDYSLHTWDKTSVKTVNQIWATAPKPIPGTIARGYVGLSGTSNSDDLMKEMVGRGHGVSTPLNGSVPYYYKDTEDERTRATKEIVGNPYPITAKGLERGKELWTIYCGICHGEKCAGNGYLVSEENLNAKYPAQPANLLLDTFVNSNNGRIYHAVMYGKNVMKGYADKLSFEERWQVIHYIRSCQADSKKLDYNANRNTFKPQYGIADSVVRAAMAAKGSGVAAPASKPLIGKQTTTVTKAVSAPAKPH
jgi:mono/diheme cytochrome c family protein